MSWQDSTRPNVLGKYENMCWSCKNAVGGCSWTDMNKKFIPVPGWDAEPDVMQSVSKGSKLIDTYRIYDCPEYEKSETA